MAYKYPFTNIPGPGDPETWGPCTGHPMDPRTPDTSEAVSEEQERICNERMNDLNGLFVESITEAPDANLAELRDAIKSGDNLKAGDIVSDMVYRYCTPSEDEAAESLGDPGDEQ